MFLLILTILQKYFSMYRVYFSTVIILGEFFRSKNNIGNTEPDSIIVLLFVQEFVYLHNACIHYTTYINNKARNFRNALKTNSITVYISSIKILIRVIYFNIRKNNENLSFFLTHTVFIFVQIGKVLLILLLYASFRSFEATFDRPKLSYQ